MNNYKIFILKTIIIIFIAIPYLVTNVYAIPILGIESDFSISKLVVDNRYGLGSDFEDADFEIENLGNTTLTVNSVTAISVPSGISVSISGKPSTIAPYNMENVYFRITADSNANEGSQKVSIQVVTDGGTDTIDINFNVDVLKPAKLGNMNDESVNILFDKPKINTPYFSEITSTKLENVGDLTMSVSSVTATTPGGGITISITDKPNSIAARSSDNLAITVMAPSTTSEGRYTSKIKVDAGAAGTETFDLDIMIKYGIVMDVSISNIDFGKVQIYEKQSKSIIVSEELGYKSIEGITLSYTPIKIYGPDSNFMSSNSINHIPAAESRTIYSNLLFNGNAKPYKVYKWNLIITSNNTGSKTIPITASMGLGVDERLGKLELLEKESSGDSEKIVKNIYTALTFSDDETKKHPDTTLSELITVISLTDSTIDLVESYNEANKLILQKNHDSAIDYLIRGSIDVKMIETYSEQITNNQIKENINFIKITSNEMMGVLIQNEASYYENNILISPNVNTLQKMNANYRLSELWGLLGNTEKESEYENKADEQNKEYNILVDSAKSKRLDAEKSISKLQSGILSKWGDTYVLLNPFNYDMLSDTHDNIIDDYNSAEDQYRLAGETGMANKTHLRFNQIMDTFQKTFLVFYIMTSFYVLLFAGVLTKSVRGLNSYKRDTEEVQLGNYLII